MDIMSIVAQLLGQQGQQAQAAAQSGMQPQRAPLGPPRMFDPFTATPNASATPNVLRQPGNGRMLPPGMGELAAGAGEFLRRATTPTLPPGSLSRPPVPDAFGPGWETGQPVPDAFAGDHSLARAPMGPPNVGPFETTVTPAAQPAPAPPVPDANAITTGAVNAAASRPRTARPASEALRQPGAFDMIDTALAGMAGGRPVLSTMGDAAEARNATYDALVGRGVSEDMARAMVLNPQMLGALAPQIFSPRTSVVNNRLVDTRTGQVLADFSDAWRAMPATSSGVVNQSTGEVRPVTGGGSATAGAPAGFQWVDPSDHSRGLSAIPGGPATRLPSETAGRVAMMRSARPGVEAARQVYERSWGVGDFAQHGAANVPGVGDIGTFSGEVGRAQRNIRVAVEAALRSMTGAAAPEHEVRQYMELFTPNARDNVESARQKLDLLTSFMDQAEAAATEGRTVTTGEARSMASSSGADGWSEIAPGIRIRERR